MAENSNPLGTDLYSAQNAIRAIIAPEEDNAAATDALEAETTEEVVEEAEPSEEMEATEETDNSVVEGSEEELEVEEDAESSEDESFDILGAIVEVDWEYSDHIMFNRKLGKLLGIPPRLPEEKVTQDHKDLAAALQAVYEIFFMRLVTTAKNITGFDNLCLGGGCAYNGVANYRAYEVFDSVHIPFAPSDAGSAIGACLYQYLLKKGTKRKENSNPYLGPVFSNKEIKHTLIKYKDRVQAFKLSDDKLFEKTAELLHAQNIVAWFQGRMEFGARALAIRCCLSLAYS